MRRSLAALASLTSIVLFSSSCIFSAVANDKGACTVEENNVLVQCVEYTNLSIAYRELVATVCSSFAFAGSKNTYKAGKGCSASMRLGGCRKTDANGTYTSWYYVDNEGPTKRSSINDITCGAGETTVDADGMALVGPDMTAEPSDLSIGPDLTAALDLLYSPPTASFDAAGYCSMDSGIPVSMTFANGHGSTISAYWIDFACKETYQFTLQPGATQAWNTYVAHMWRFRAGDHNDSGTIVYERVTPLDDNGKTLTVP